MVGNHVEVALRVGFVEIGGGRKDAVAKGHDGRQTFQSGGGAQRVAVHALGGTNRQILDAGTENGVDGGGFGDIVGQRAGAVGVDVADLLGGEPGVAQGGAHGAGGAFGRGLGDVGSVGGHRSEEHTSE